MPTIDVTDDPARFEEAVRQFRKRVPVTDAEWARLTQAEAEFAFRVAGVAQADLVTETWEALDRAVADGSTLADFKAEVGAKLEAAWGEADPARLETVFRTNTQGAYNAGRHEILTDPAVRRARAYWRFDATMDSRTSEVCEALDGTIRPADDPFWHTHTPPLHHNCRSIITPLTDEEAEDEGVSDAAPKVPADEGFGAAPTVGSDWEPDLSAYPDAIADILRERLR